MADKDKKPWVVRDEAELANMRERNNPRNEPTGHYTGRCKRCGSNRLWDDNAAYGCEDCGAFWTAGNFGL